MNLASTLTLQASSLFAGVRIEGFTRGEEEYVRAGMSRVPPELLKNISVIRSDRGMGAKHGNYDLQTRIISLNPRNFFMRQRLGRGPGWIWHAETTMVHEIGHSVFEGLTQEQKNEWNSLSGWIKSGEDKPGFDPRYIERRPGWPPYRSEWIHRKGVRFTRHYAEKSPDEDFADSFSFFMLGKPFQMAPQKRKFLEALIAQKVHRYPQAVIQGPERAYGERGN